ncbi:MAG: hypothetical protein XXXJIFNMEKO3_00841 [Candidatus Erwinia impunctatus]|nr:hypothetical protein XXXJIFNMEKO_00841 [Culicoides impunctatus]
MSGKIPVGISACLLGNNVRFDGGHKRNEFAAEHLAPFIEYEAVCPEMAIGLPVPRPALRLVATDAGTTEMCFSQRQEDPVTQAMEAFSEKKIATLHHLCGYILCAKSPSCGMERVRLYRPEDNSNRKEGVGLFARELMKQMPWLPVEEDGRLHDPVLRENFVERIYTLHEFHSLWRSGLTRGKLIEFHSRHKLSLLAHCQADYRAMGRFVAEIDQWSSIEEFAFEYRQKIMDLMKQRATRKNHTNVLMHVQGYFRPQLTSKQRQELASIIDDYRQGLQPLLVPIAMLKHYMSEYPHPYLAEQRYFKPYPETLRLRYGH